MSRTAPAVRSSQTPLGASRRTGRSAPRRRRSSVVAPGQCEPGCFDRRPARTRRSASPPTSPVPHGRGGTKRRQVTEKPLVENETHYAEAVIDNGSFGTRTIRFETGRLARQAAGSAVAYLDDDPMVLSATTASKNPKEQFDFFPLTVDVEERMYAAGRMPGSFFRREGRPSTDAILACRLIDRPLRPLFVKSLRNEVQVVVTVLALHPDDAYDTLAINAASLSTQISGLPFSGPVGAVRIALVDGQWVAFPKYSDKERAVFDMVVAGRVVGDDVAIAMIEAEATD